VHARLPTWKILLECFSWAASFPLAAQSLLLLPEYSAESLVNAASQRSGRIAPNTIFTVYGKNLSFSTWALGPGDIRNGNLPTDVPGLNVNVLVRGLPVPLYYVSPTQINALLPANFSPGLARIEITRGVARGPRVEFQIGVEEPDLFAFEGGWAAATHPDGRAVSEAQPVKPGDYVVVYGTGWGSVETSLQQQHIATSGALLRRWGELRVRVGEFEVVRPELFYAGLTPGFAGLYQVNFRVPPELRGNAELSLQIGGRESGAKVRLPIATESPAQPFQP
jgi:uncharacterized protein (TIGR03437 family)